VLPDCSTLVLMFWHGRAIPLLSHQIYVDWRAVLGEGCPGVQWLARAGTPVLFSAYSFYAHPSCVSLIPELRSCVTAWMRSESF